MKIEKYSNLFTAAISAMDNSYSPYSHFSVGAAVLLDDDKIITGTNIENASYGLACCAERNALFAVYGAGYHRENIISLLVVGKTKTPISPCGACRQVICELMPEDAEIIMSNIDKKIKIVTIKELLPYSFNSGDLDV